MLVGVGVGMIKALGTDSNGGRVVYLGLTPENILLLQQDKPIIFLASEIGLKQPSQIAMVWDTPAVRKHMSVPEGVNAFVLDDMLLFILTDAMLEKMKSAALEIPAPNEMYILYFRKTLAELEEFLPIDKGTEVKRSSAPEYPGSKPNLN